MRLGRLLPQLLRQHNPLSFRILAHEAWQSNDLALSVFGLLLMQKHTVFGEVSEGLEVLAKINEAFVDDNHRPLVNIRIKHTHILDDPFDDPAQLASLIPDASPELKPVVCPLLTYDSNAC